ncbi:protein yellow-like [Cloeon dipterum]|uniref:protein yellow-like n=1 Tax=Cloeon dipterum TaxID=197152 RepID=UPI00321F8FFC
MAVFGERLFLSLSMDTGIPANLVWLPTSGSSAAPPKLAPFPSWNMQKQDYCDTIQLAKGMEVDPEGRLWVLDDGRGSCSSKIWIFDLLNNDTTERVHRFPHKVVSSSFDKRWLHDIVLDKTPDDQLAYIVNLKSEDIVVYSRKMDKSWLVKAPGGDWFSLALSPDRETTRQLYLLKYSSNGLYSVPVSELKNEGGIADVKLIGGWSDRPYRMVFDSANILYAAFYEQSYASKWNVSEPFREQRFHEVGTQDDFWPFTFALDTNGSLWMTERNETGGVKKHKLLKAAVGAKPYLFGTPTGK